VSLFDRRNPSGYPTRPAYTDRRGTSHIWLISYSDFMTVLMIFFLAMYGYAYMAKMSLRMKERITYSEFTNLMQQLKGRLDDKIEIQEDLEKITIKLPENMLFSSGRANLTPKATRTIEDLANSIKLVSGRIIVEGHTDTVPVVSGRYKDNWELSAARSFSVIDALTKGGVSPKRLSAWGFGENRPVAPNNTRRNRLKNRRIEIVLLKIKKEETTEKTEGI